MCIRDSAEACGVGKYFQFTVEELADAQLLTVGLTLDGLRVAGTARFPITPDPSRSDNRYKCLL